MFGDDIFSSFFNTPFLQSNSIANTQHSGRIQLHNVPACRERCSRSSRDLFSEISRAVDRVFAATTQSFFDGASMFRRHLHPDYLREISTIPQVSGRNTGVTLNGEVVERTVGNSRFGRHRNDEPVQMDRTRLQWYDSNTRRSLLPPPPPQNRPEPSGRLNSVELSKLPISTFHIKPLSDQQSDQNSPSRVQQPLSVGTPVRVLNRNESNADFSPGSAYLQPVSRIPTLVQIQPLQASPARGFPECEICLTEYRDKDRLRHLPCGHGFHSKCIDVWLNQSSTCPKCRAGVRTGLKRLERNRQRERNTTRLAGNAPVRAIRQQSTWMTANRRTAGTTQTSTSRTPVQRANRNQPSVGNSTRRSSSLSSQINTSSDNSFRQTEAVSGDHVTSGTSDHEPDLSQSRSLSDDLAGPERDVSTGASEPQSAEPRPRSTTAVVLSRTNSNSTITRRLGGQTPLSGTMDKSAFARQKAGEAAIRRAELARQEQERQRAQQQQ